jgi:hypothetical protein
MTCIKTTSSFHYPKYVEGIEPCYHCANSCEYCGTLCLREMNKAFFRVCRIALLLRANERRFASKHMSCDSRRVKEFSDYCAKACEDCAAECDKHYMNQCKQYGNVCLECSDICKKIAS